MTDEERRLYERIRRRAAEVEPEMGRRMLAAFDVVRQSLSPTELAAAARNGTIERFVTLMMGDEPLDRAFAPLRELIDTRVLSEARRWTKDIPGAIRPPMFDSLNPDIIESIRSLDTRVINGLKGEVRETVRSAAEEALKDGAHPDVAARRIRSAVGMAPNQAAAVANFRRKLEAGSSTALSYKLRDRRFDGTLRRAVGRGGTGLSPQQIDRMVSAYEKRMIAHNAKTQARTAALDAQRLAQRTSWENAIGMGVADRKDLRRTWISSQDGKVRPTHVEMHGTTVTWDEPYPNGQMLPGDSEYNCRCIERISLGDPADAISSQAARKNAPPGLPPGMTVADESRELWASALASGEVGPNRMLKYRNAYERTRRVGNTREVAEDAARAAVGLPPLHIPTGPTNVRRATVVQREALSPDEARDWRQRGGPPTFTPLPDERVTTAAIKLEDGRVVEGATHGFAFFEAQDLGLVRAGDKYVDGYVTSAGRFINREEAQILTKLKPKVNPGLGLTTEDIKQAGMLDVKKPPQRKFRELDDELLNVEVDDDTDLLDRWGEDNWASWRATLTQDEADAFEEYVGGFGPALVEYQRTGTISQLTADDIYRDVDDALETARKMEDALDMAIARVVVPEDIVVFRGMNAPDLYRRATRDPQSLIGSTLPQEPSVISASLNRDTSWNFLTSGDRAPDEGAVLLEIQLPRGTHGAYISTFGEINNLEYEILLGRGNSFTVRDVTMRDGVAVIRVDINEAEPMSLPPTERSTTAAMVITEPPPLSTALQKKLDSSEAMIKSRDVEHAMVFAPDGTRLTFKVGSKGAVGFTNSEVDKFRDKDAVFTHNHPLDDMTFSAADIKMALEIDARQMRAVTRDGTVYVMERPAAGWVPGGRGPNKVTQSEIQRAWDEMEFNFDENVMPNIRGGQRALDRAWNRAQHEFWTEVAEARGWVYRRIGGKPL